MNDTNIDEMKRLSHEQAVGILRTRDITPTRQRVEIASVLLGRPQHVCADQLLAQVNREDSLVSKATVYNTLGLFARKGLVREVLVDPTKVFYDSNTHPHHHYYNESTGALFDVPDGGLRLAAQPVGPEGMAVVGVDVVIRVKDVDR